MILHYWRQMTKNLKLVLGLIFILQILVAMNFELAHDEAYYWLYSKNLAWGYFDHPPFVAIAIKMFSFIPQPELSVRLGFIVIQFLSLGFILTLVPSSYWMLSSLLYFAFPLSSMTGILALPDMPLVFMTSAYMFCLNRYLEKDDAKSSSVLGVVISLLLYAKYHGILLVFFTILALPKLLKRKSFYLVAVISIILFLPHMWWQYQHEFASLRYHFIERPSSSFSIKRVSEYLASQIFLAGLFIGPILWWKLGKFKSESDFARAMKLICFGIVIFFLISSFSKKVEANWTILLAPPLIYLASLTGVWKNPLSVLLVSASFAIVLLARILLILPPQIIPIKRLHEFHGWKKWSEEMNTRCGEGQLVANNYQIASKLSFYLNRNIPALNIGSRKNQFDYWRFDQNIPTEGICYITDKSEFTGEEVISPDGKHLVFVTNKKLLMLQKIKNR